MPRISRFGAYGNESDPHALRRTILGILTGGGLFVAIMLLFAGMAVAFGWVRQDEAGRVNLRPWLILEIIGGAAASVLGGAVSRRIARRYHGPVVLALMVFSVGVLEATEVLRHTTSGSAAAPQWLVLLAPVVAAAGALFGGWLPAKGSSEKAAQQAGSADRAARRG